LTPGTPKFKQEALTVVVGLGVVLLLLLVRIVLVGHNRVERLAVASVGPPLATGSRGGGGGHIRPTAAKVHGPLVAHAHVQSAGDEEVGEAQGQQGQHQEGQVQEQVVGPLVVEAVRRPLLPALAQSCGGNRGDGVPD